VDSLLTFDEYLKSDKAREQRQALYEGVSA